MVEFKCTGCGGERFERGSVYAKFTSPAVFTPRAAGWWKRVFGLGPPIEASVCLQCGLVHMHTDVDDVMAFTGDTQTRCRQCRHILRGITEPRCPECGEAI